MASASAVGPVIRELFQQEVVAGQPAPERGVSKGKVESAVVRGESI